MIYIVQRNFQVILLQTIDYTVIKQCFQDALSAREHF
jgi:hypothetical protein